MLISECHYCQGDGVDFLTLTTTGTRRPCRKCGGSAKLYNGQSLADHQARPATLDRRVQAPPRKAKG